MMTQTAIGGILDGPGVMPRTESPLSGPARCLGWRRAGPAGDRKGGDMNGYMKVQLGAWTNAARAAAGMAWPVEWSMLDLDYWAHAVTHHGQVMPSYAQLAERWGCSRAAARSRVGRWRVTSQEDHTRITGGSQEDHRRITGGSQPGGGEGEQSGGSHHRRITGGSQEDHRRITGGSQEDHSGRKGGRLTNANRVPKKEEEEEEAEAPYSVAVATPHPAWCRAVKGAKPAQVVEGVTAIVSAVRGQPTAPAKTTAAPVLALYRATELPWSDFVAAAVLVSEAAHGSPDRLFARDIRAEGWPDGADRRRDVATVMRRDRWQARLDAARAWDAAGRPSGQSASRPGWATVGRGATLALDAAIAAGGAEDDYIEF